MPEMKRDSVPLARLQAKTIQSRVLRAALCPGRRWTWCGKRGWWLHCWLLDEQEGTWHTRRFVASVAEACAMLHIHEEDWTWQPAVLKEAYDQPPEPQASGVFPLF